MFLSESQGFTLLGVAWSRPQTMWSGCSLKFFFFPFYFWPVSPNYCTCFILRQIFPLKYKLLCQQLARLHSSLFISVRKEKSISDTSYKRRSPSFPWRLRKYFWSGYTPISEPIGGKGIETLWFLWANRSHCWKWTQSHIQTRIEHGEGKVPHRKSEKWEMDAEKHPINVYYLLPFSPCFSFFLSFFPSLLYGKFCAWSRGYKHENIFSALEAP